MGTMYSWNVRVSSSLVEKSSPSLDREGDSGKPPPKSAHGLAQPRYREQGQT